MLAKDVICDRIYNNKELFGLEIETELLEDATNEGELVTLDVEGLESWLHTYDGSLKGMYNAEWVLNKPLSFGKTVKAVSGLYDYLEGFGVVDTVRAGVHIHVNVNGWSIERITRLLILYWLVETALISTMGGRGRLGNHFCLPIRDSDVSVFAFRSLLKYEYVIKNRGLNEFFKNEAIKYSAANLSTLPKYGSIEFRFLRTPTEEEPIIRLLAFLNNLVRWSGTCKLSPSDIITGMSGGPIDESLVEIAPFLSELDLANPERKTSVVRNMRLVQSVAYAIDWTEGREAAPEDAPVDTNFEGLEELIAEAFEDEEFQ